MLVHLPRDRCCRDHTLRIVRRLRLPRMMAETERGVPDWAENCDAVRKAKPHLEVSVKGSVPHIRIFTLSFRVPEQVPQRTRFPHL